MKQMSGKDLARWLEQHDWVLLRIQGSHHIYSKPGSAVRLSVPVHGDQPLKAGLLGHLLKMARLSDKDMG